MYHPAKHFVFHQSTCRVRRIYKDLTTVLDKDLLGNHFRLFAAHVIFAQHDNMGMRMCIDYRQLHRYTRQIGFDPDTTRRHVLRNARRRCRVYPRPNFRRLTPPWNKIWTPTKHYLKLSSVITNSYSGHLACSMPCRCFNNNG